MTLKDALIAGKLAGGGGVTPTGTLSITDNGQYDVTQYAEADVDVSSGDFLDDYKTLIQRNKNNLTLPSGITAIAKYLFYGWNELNIASLPNSITDIGEYAFNGCSALNVDSLPDSLINIGSHAFFSCGNLAISELPDSIASIGANAFSYCYRIKITKIPNALKAIPVECFSQCRGLTEITIHENIESIGNKAFTGSINLTKITCLATVPPTLGNNVFQSIKSNFIIYVPSASVATYQSATNWSAYSSHIQAIQE